MVGQQGEEEGAQSVSIAFLMLSGETFTVQEFIEDENVEEGIRKLGQQLVEQIRTATVRQFHYWEGDEFFFDAVRMDQVGAFSISSAEVEEEDEDEL